MFVKFKMPFCNIIFTPNIHIDGACKSLKLIGIQIKLIHNNLKDKSEISLV